VTKPLPIDSDPAGRVEDETSITAALLDALCSPHLYEIVLRGGELFIKPRPRMHSGRLAAAAM